MIAVAAGHMVVPAMEMADEAEDLGAPGMRAREAQGHQRGLGA